MSSRNTWLRELLFLALAIAVGLVMGRFLLVGSASEQPPPRAAGVERPVPDPRRIEGMQASWFEGESPILGKTEEPPEGVAVFPDGTWLEPINGVEKAPPFPDHPGWDFSPVVRIHTEPTTGLQWYIHEKGEVSTLYNVEHQVGDRKWTEPNWILGRPAKSQPIR